MDLASPLTEGGVTKEINNFSTSTKIKTKDGFFIEMKNIFSEFISKILKWLFRALYTLLCQIQQVLIRLRHFWAAQSSTNEQVDAAAMLNRSFSIARHRNPILHRFKLWKDFFKDQFSHSSLSANQPQHEILNLFNIWFIQASYRLSSSKSSFHMTEMREKPHIQNNE